VIVASQPCACRRHAEPLIADCLDCRRPALAAFGRSDASTVSLLGALVLVVLATFGDYAISNDEEVQQHYGELIIAYYTSGFADRAAFGFRNLYLYGGLFDIVAVLLGGHCWPARST